MSFEPFSFENLAWEIPATLDFLALAIFGISKGPRGVNSADIMRGVFDEQGINYGHLL